MKKRFISTLLAFVTVACLLPTAAIAETSYELYVGGVGLASGEYLAVGATETTSTQPDGGYAYYNDGILTLCNYIYEGEGSLFGSERAAAIYYSGSDELTIDLYGTSSVTQTSSNALYLTCGIFSRGELKIVSTDPDGPGELTSIGGMTTNEGSNSCGVIVQSQTDAVDCGITVFSGRLIGIGGEACDISYGVIADDITVIGGSLTGVGSSVTSQNYYSCGLLGYHGITLYGGELSGFGGEGNISYGVAACSNIIVYGGELSGFGGTANSSSSGVSAIRIYDDDMAIVKYGNITISGGKLSGFGGTAGDSYGVYARDSITVSGGELSGEGGAASDSRGVYARDNTTVSGGGLSGEGGEADDYSCGVYISAEVTVSGGKLSGFGGTASDSRGVYARYSTTVSGGELSGEGGTAGDSRGVYVYADITVSGGKLSGEGGETDDYSCGVYVYADITVSGGEVVAQGKGTAFNKEPAINAEVRVGYGTDKITAAFTFASSLADEYYSEQYVSIALFDLCVSGVKVLPDNASDVLGDGRVKYDVATNTLILNQVEINNTSGEGIKAAGDLVISGTGSVTGSTYGILVDGTLSVEEDSVIETTGDVCALAVGNGIYTSDLIVSAPENSALGSVDVGAEEKYDTYGTRDEEYNFTPAETVRFEPGYTVNFYVGDSTDWIEQQAVAKGGTVGKPADPTLSGYTFGGWYLDPDCTEAYDFETAVYEHLWLYAKWTENAPVVDEACPLYGYTDLDISAWYHDGIHYCIEQGLMQGVGNGLFNHDGTTTRAMIVTILWRMEGSPVVNYATNFEDVDEDRWYTEAIRWAASEKIAEGYGNGNFGVNDAITREQIMTVMFRYAKYKGCDVSVGENTDILSYGDGFEVAEWATPAMQWACGSGMIQVIADGNTTDLAPQGIVTRAQTAAILQHYCEHVINKD